MVRTFYWLTWELLDQFSYVDKTCGTYLLKENFGAVRNDMNIHIVISRSHIDHYSFMTSALDKELIPLVMISKVILANFGKSFHKWLSTNINHVYSVNNEKSCFGNTKCTWTPISTTNSMAANITSAKSITGQKRDPWQFCGRKVDIMVLGSNIGTIYSQL